MAQNGSYNLHKMVKNAPNELKFYQTCFYMGIIKFWKIFGKFSKLADFCPKNSHLARFPYREIMFHNCIFVAGEPESNM